MRNNGAGVHNGSWLILSHEWQLPGDRLDALFEFANLRVELASLRFEFARALPARLGQDPRDSGLDHAIIVCRIEGTPILDRVDHALPQNCNLVADFNPQARDRLVDLGHVSVALA